MAAAGRVVTGFSKPYVAKYTDDAGKVTYSGCRQLARGVEVSIDPEVGGDNDFFADNVKAESAPGTFTGGTVTLTVDGLLLDSERFIMGMPEPQEVSIGEGKNVKVQGYGDAMQIPYMGFGCIVRYQSDGEVEYVPTILTKTRFRTTGLSAATQEEDIDWQTTELTADLMRDDTEYHHWRLEAEGFKTEAEAEKVVKFLLGEKDSTLSSAINTPIVKEDSRGLRL